MKFIKGHSRHMKRWFFKHSRTFFRQLSQEITWLFWLFRCKLLSACYQCGPWGRRGSKERGWEGEKEQEEEEGERRKVGMKQTDWGIDMRSWNKINRKQKPPIWGTAKKKKLWTENPGRRLHRSRVEHLRPVVLLAEAMWLTVERWS